jgi:helix-turn-helix protein/uncharacterized protein DUF4115
VFDIGSSLRDARVRQGLDFPELEQLTRIRPKYLRALEDEHFDVLPAPTYVRGFLRSYAAALGLDGQPFVDEYNSRFAVGEEDVVVRARRVPPPRRDRQDRESRIAVLALVAIAVVTALVIAAWRFGGDSNTKLPLSSPVKVHPRGGLLVRATKGATLLIVRAGSDSGKQVYQGTLAKGTSQRFGTRRGLWVYLGTPENVQLKLNGRAVLLGGGQPRSLIVPAGPAS